MKTGFVDFIEQKKGVIFDCDGVIIDSKKANVKFYNLILKELNLPPMNKEQEDVVHSFTVYDSIKYIVPEELFEKALEIGEKIPYIEVLHLIELEESLIDLLELLKKHGKKCAINTNRTTTMPFILSKYNLNNYFDPVVTASIVKNPKPHPESIFLILKEWDMEPDEVFFIGDSEVDEKTAQNVPVDFVSYKNPNLNGIFNIESYKEVVDWLRE